MSDFDPKLTSGLAGERILFQELRVGRALYTAGARHVAGWMASAFADGKAAGWV